MKWTLLLIFSLFSVSQGFAQKNSADSLQKTDTLKTVFGSLKKADALKTAAGSLQKADTLKPAPKKEVEPTIDEKNNEVLLYIAKQAVAKGYYKLYPTTNIWTFLKLDTRTGQIWKVQFDAKDDNRFQTPINSDDLTYGGNVKASCFELYPTQNIYNFLLLDKVTGRVWQVQWSLEPEEMGMWIIL